MDSKIFSEVLPSVVSKSDKRKQEIILAAIDCFASAGIDGTHYEMIAQRCKASRPLIIHYFPEKSQLVEIVVRYIRVNFQHLSLQAILKHKEPGKQFLSFLESQFEWFERHESHVKVWISFYRLCSSIPSFRRLNTEMVRMGHERISSLVGAMRPSLSRKQTLHRGRLVQTLLTGTLVSLATENPLLPKKEYIKQINELCLHIVTRDKGETKP